TESVEYMPYTGPSIAGAGEARFRGISRKQQELSFDDYPTTSSARRRGRRNGSGTGTESGHSRDHIGPRASRDRRAGLATCIVGIWRRQIPRGLQALR